MFLIQKIVILNPMKPYTEEYFISSLGVFNKEVCMLLAIIFVVLCIIITSIVTVRDAGNIGDFFMSLFAFMFVFLIIHATIYSFMSSFTVDAGTVKETLYNIEGLESNMVTNNN